MFVPQLVRAMKDGDGGMAYTDRLLTLAGLVLVGLTAAADARRAADRPAATHGSQLDADDSAVATLFAYWCLPQIFFYGLYTMLGQVLNARGRFGPMMWAPILNNVVAIATGLMFIMVVDRRTPGTSRSLDSGQIALLGPARRSASSCRRWRSYRCCGGRLPLHPRWDLRGSGLGEAAIAGQVDARSSWRSTSWPIWVITAADRRRRRSARTRAAGVGFPAYRTPT